jgi:2-polyprenyl-6-methoxyphenol hydroxylase-like FAD-dependent oxidoreductase
MLEREVDALIVGAGPAGMLFGFLLAREGRRVLVAERNADFGREYRGEVLMPRAHQVLEQVGLAGLLGGPVARTLRGIEFFRGSHKFAEMDLTRLRADGTSAGAVWMPQPVFLEALRAEAAQHPGFEMWFEAWPRELLRRNERTEGALLVRGEDEARVHARLTVGADGRYSALRHLGGFALAYHEHDFDVLWFSTPETTHPRDTFRACIGPRRSYLILPKHPADLQCGMLMPRNGFAAYRNRGLDALRSDLAEGPPEFAEFARTLTDFTPFHPLHAHLDLVADWARPGLLLIGDAAHTCSPMGAIGVAVALETAAVAAEIVLEAWGEAGPDGEALARIQHLREPEVRAIHRFQRRFGRPIASPRRWPRRAMTTGLALAGRLGLLPALTRRIVSRRRPLPLARCARG